MGWEQAESPSFLQGNRYFRSKAAEEKLRRQSSRKEFVDEDAHRSCTEFKQVHKKGMEADLNQLRYIMLLIRFSV